MKTTDFFWSWNSQPAIPDLSMNRARAATLLKAWRQKAALAKAGRAEWFSFQRVTRGVYRVRTVNDLTGTMFLGSDGPARTARRR